MTRPSLAVLSVLSQTSLLAGAPPEEIESAFVELGLSRPQDPSRRQFLKAMGLGAAAIAGGAVLGEAIEKALWVPGAKTFFLPPEKPALVSGDAAVAALKAVEARPLHAALLGAVHDVPTGAGVALFDADWNLLTIRGQAVSALDAAKLQSGTYGTFGTPRHTPAELRQLASEIQARWDLAGLSTKAQREAAAGRKA